MRAVVKKSVIDGREIITIKARRRIVSDDPKVTLQFVESEILEAAAKHIKYGIRDVDNEDYVCGYIRLVGGAAIANPTP